MEENKNNHGQKVPTLCHFKKYIFFCIFYSELIFQKCSEVNICRI